MLRRFFLFFVLLYLAATEAARAGVLSEKIDADIYAEMIAENVISRDDVKLYKNIFKSLKNNDYEEADDLFSDVESPLLRGHVLAEKYLSSGYKSTYEELKDWLIEYADHPQAARIYRLAGRKGAKEDLNMPLSCGDGMYGKPLLNAESEAYARLNSKNKTWVIGRVRKFYNYINRGKTRLARSVLENKRFRMLIPDKYWDDLSGRLALSYLLDNYDKLAEQWSRKPARRSHSATAYWVGGLASWRMGKYQQAANYFSKLGALKNNDEWLEAAGAYWAFRANMKLKRTQKAQQQLETAARYQRTFYGILAAYTLGKPLDYNWSETTYWNDFSTSQYAKDLLLSPAIVRAVALFHAKRPDLAEAELRNAYTTMNETQKEAMLFLSEKYDRHGLAIKISNDLKDYDRLVFYDSLAYPVPDWLPAKDNLADPALVLALIRQESGFNPRAVSSAGACGLMQLMPSTAYYVQKDNQLKRDRSKLFDAAYNIETGRKYVNYLLEKDYIDGNLFFMTAAYNAGPGNLMKWKKKAKYQNDPLLFIEVLPAQQTRLYIERVMANYWIYEMRAGRKPESLAQLQSGLWPTVRSTD